jgi:hypothetical protein
MKTGAATAPWWIRGLQAAEAWGVPPWEVVGKKENMEGVKLLWWMRFGAYQREQARAREKD